MTDKNATQSSNKSIIFDERQGFPPCKLAATSTNRTDVKLLIYIMLWALGPASLLV